MLRRAMKPGNSPEACVNSTTTSASINRPFPIIAIGIAMAIAESSVNQIISKRFVKEKQMRWSRRGAHLLLQVRTRILDGILTTTFPGTGAGITLCREPADLRCLLRCLRHTQSSPKTMQTRTESCSHDQLKSHLFAACLDNDLRHLLIRHLESRGNTWAKHSKSSPHTIVAWMSRRRRWWFVPSSPRLTVRLRSTCKHFRR